MVKPIPLIVVLGSPAHAGIDLEDSASASYAIRFPRTRGDRPIAWAPILGPARVPPHTRG